jgi:hypothetical protein
MKRKKTIKFHVGGSSGADFEVTVRGNYGRAMTRDESARHMSRLTSEVIASVQRYTLIPFTEIKTK